MKNSKIKEEVIANVALINKEWKILMHKRRDKKTNEIYWSFFGGKMEKIWEKPRITAIREVEEETGYRIQETILFAGKNIVEYKWKSGNTRKERFLYITPLEKEISDLTVTEGEWAEFFTPEEINSLVLKKPLDTEIKQVQEQIRKIQEADFSLSEKMSLEIWCWSLRRRVFYNFQKILK